MNAAAVVAECPKAPVGSQWPYPVEQRMRDLVAVANGAGLRTSKQELLAALVCATDPSEEAIVLALRSYRTATVAEISLREADDGNVISIERRGPGRRAHE